jgi:hypothetical protein
MCASNSELEYEYVPFRLNILVSDILLSYCRNLLLEVVCLMDDDGYHG